MEHRVLSNYGSLAGSSARSAEAARKSESARVAQAERLANAPRRPRPLPDLLPSTGMGFNLRAQGTRPASVRLFPGPSARPAAIAPEPAATPAPPVQVKQAPYSETFQTETVTSVGARLKNAFRSLFT